MTSGLMLFRGLVCLQGQNGWFMRRSQCQVLLYAVRWIELQYDQNLSESSMLLGFAKNVMVLNFFPQKFDVIELSKNVPH